MVVQLHFIATPLHVTVGWTLVICGLIQVWIWFCEKIEAKMKRKRKNENGLPLKEPAS